MGGIFPLADAHAKNQSGSPREGKSLPIHENAMGYHGSNCATKHTLRQCGGLECTSNQQMVRFPLLPRAAGDL